jgi:hypothetical protein
MSVCKLYVAEFCGVYGRIEGGLKKPGLARENDPGTSIVSSTALDDGFDGVDGGGNGRVDEEKQMIEQ